MEAEAGFGDSGRQLYVKKKKQMTFKRHYFLLFPCKARWPLSARAQALTR